MNLLALTNNLDRPEAFLLRAMSEKGISITLVVDIRSPFQEILQHSSIKILHHKFKSRIDPASVIYLRRLFKSQTFNLVHSFSARALASTMLSGSGSKIPHVTYRGTLGHISRFDPSARLCFFNSKLTKIICVSNAVKVYMASRGIPQEKLVRIYKGHDPSWYIYDKSFDLTTFSIPKAAFVVCCSANMRPVKGVDVLVEAFCHIPKNLPIHLLLIGEDREKRIVKLLKNHPLKNRIHLAGFRSDAPHIAGACDLFCMPSRKREGLSKSLLEAMMQGVPAVITNVGGMPEMVRNGLDGLVVPPEDPKSLAQAIVKVYEAPELRRQMGQNARERLKADFSIQKTIEETFKVYESCL